MSLGMALALARSWLHKNVAAGCKDGGQLLRRNSCMLWVKWMVPLQQLSYNVGTGSKTAVQV